MTCPACGTANPDEARFCLSCGHQMVARNDERRIASVVFADLVGFTALSETRDPEQVKRLVDECFEVLAADITAFGGRIDKIMGDAIIALFGAPVAHEDDAERAVRAALRMQESLGAYAADSAAAELRLRIGVNTGEVLVGALRAGGDYTAMGDVVNIAQRLQVAAEPGSVLVGPSTRAATDGVIEYQSLPPVHVKGREEPVGAWVALEPLRPPGYRRRRVQTPFVGRDSELGVMQHAVDTAVERRRAHLLLILGEAGVGKSRLAGETAKAARMRHRARVFEGRCVPYGEANVWWPIAEAIRQACEIPADASIGEADGLCAAAVSEALGEPPRSAEVKRIVNGLLFLMGYPVALRDIDPQRAREEATRSIVAFLVAIMRTRPVVLKLSDLHWADESLLTLVDELIDQLSRCPFVLVASARHELIDSWTARTGRHNSVVTHLDPLERAAVMELLDSLAGGAVLEESAREALLDRSGGNPFFLEELVALMSTDDAAVDGPPRTARRAEGVAGPSPSAPLPDTLRGIVAARIDALLPAERTVLEGASVWGRSGSIEALTVMIEQMHGPIEVPAVLETLVDLDVMAFDNERWKFRSDLVREVAYNMLTKSDRARRHAGIAWYLERTSASPSEAGDRLAAVIAHHYATAAGLVDEMGLVEGLKVDLHPSAVRWLEEAALRSERSRLLPTARQLYTQALDLLQDGAPHHRARLLLGRGAANTELRHLDEARTDIEAAHELLRHDDGDPALTGRVLLLTGDLHQKTGELDLAAKTLGEAAAHFEGIGDNGGRADALRNLGLTRLFLGETGPAEEAIHAARASYAEAGDRRGEAWAMQNLAWLSFMRGRSHEAEQRINESVDTFRELGDSGGLSWSVGLLAYVKMHEGRLHDAEELGKQVLVEARQRGDRWGEGMMLMLMALVRLWSGRTEAAMAAAADAHVIFTSIGDRFGEVQSTAALARSEVMAGRVQEGLHRLQAAQDAAAGLTHHEEEKHFVATVLAATAVQVGDPELALRALASGPEDDDAGHEAGAIGNVDRRVARGLAQLQSGRVDKALDDLHLAVDEEGATHEGATSAWALGALALAQVVAARPEEANATADLALVSPRATYLDRSLAHLARAFAARRLGVPVDAAMAALHAEVEASDDRLLGAIAGMARSALGQSSPDAELLRTESDDLLSLLGIDAIGWRTVFENAALAVV